MLPTEDLNKTMHEHRCQRLGVEDFEVDWTASYMRDPDKTATKVHQQHFLWLNEKYEEEQKFYCPVVRWKYAGKWYAGAVPVKLKTKEESNLVSTTIWSEEDWNLMEHELIKMIERCKVQGADEIL